MTRSHFREELRTLLTEFRYLSPASFAWRGAVYDLTASDDGRGAPVDGSLTPKALERLGEVLYSGLHCRLSPESWNASVYDDRPESRAFVAALSDENRGIGPWQGGWRVERVEADGAVHASRHGVTFAVPTAEARAGADAPRVREDVFIRIPKEQRSLLPGFYLAIGDADNTMRVEATTRVYWNVQASGAAPLMRALTTRLNRALIPFWFKTLSVPDKYRRTDAAVLYLPHDRWPCAVRIIADIAEEVRPWLRASVSAFAFPLAPGIAVAEDPGNDRSFGQHRSMLLARGLSAHHAAGTDEALRAICALIRDEGFDPDALHLGVGSSASYVPLEERGA